MSRPKAWMAWSSGKDAAWALHVARESGEFDILRLLMTVSKEYGRVTMHAVREELVAAQARSLGLPVHFLSIPSPCPQEMYDTAMRSALARASAEGVSRVIFGDLFLEDVRAYRVERTHEAGLQTVFPLWQLDTRVLAREMIEGGLEAIVTSVDPKQAPREIIGHAFDGRLLASLPPSVDPCGENGEFHTFAWNGPMFSEPVAVVRGEVVERDGFLFTDLLPLPPPLSGASGELRRRVRRRGVL
jgi:uncharacterized protein (TIGR00290 family)